MVMVTDWGEETKTLGKSTYKLSYQSAKDLHEKGKHSEKDGKQGELNAQISESTSIQPTGIGEQTPHMIWELRPTLENEPKFKYVMASNKDQENKVECHTTQASDMGPMAMCYDPNEGWVTSKLGLTSGHWIRKAKDVKPNKPKGEISP